MKTVDLMLWEDSEHERRAEEYRQAAEELAQVKAEMAEARALLRTFTAEHDRLVRPLYVELNGIEAEIADVQAGRTVRGDDVHEDGERNDGGDDGGDDSGNDRGNDSRDDARDAGRARERTRASDSNTYSSWQPRNAPRPSADVKKLYRRLARRSHPDLAAGDADRAVREVFMARVNNAYAQGDADALSTLAEEWEGARPSSASGTRPGRSTRQRPVPANVLNRLAAAKTELLMLKTTGLGGILFDSADGDMADALRRLEAVADEVRERVAGRRAVLDDLLRKAA